MQKKKLFIFVLLIAVLAAGTCIFLSQPRPIIDNDAENIDIYRVFMFTNGNEEDVTGQIDMEQLSSIISEYECSRVSKRFAPYSLNSITFEINLNVDSESLHILLGDINVAYTSAEKGGYEIKNADKLTAEISALLGS